MAGSGRSAGRRKRQIFRIVFLVSLGILCFGLGIRALGPRTYVITDGNRVVSCTCPPAPPERILRQAGVELGEYDRFSEEGTRIQVQRAQRIALWLRGEAQTVTSPGETVGELLTRLGIELQPEDMLSHGKETLTFDGMVLRVDAVVKRQERYSAAVAHEISYCTDAEAPLGEETVLIPGQEGELLRTAEVTYVNSQETNRRILTERVTIPPVAELVAVGTGAPAPEAEEPPALIVGDGYLLLGTGELLTYTRTDTVEATGYTHTDAGCDFITSTGTVVQRGTAAVDPRFIPYGTRMFVVSNDGKHIYGLAVAEDCGGAIKRDRMDLYFPTYSECIQFGRRRCTIYFLG